MFFGDKRIVYVILAIFVISGIAGMSQNSLLSLVLTLPAVLVAITFHEFAHAYAATKLGDDTPMLQGRLNLNPFSHIDPVRLCITSICRIWLGKTSTDKP